jgi:hypothetical protein
MKPPTSAREALIAEALGDVATLLARVDAVTAALHTSCDAVQQASARMEARASQMDDKVRLLTEVATAVAVKHVARRTEYLVRSVAELQTRAMEGAARDLFQRELTPALQRLSRITSQANVSARWWTCVGIAAASSSATFVATAWWMSR